MMIKLPKDKIDVIVLTIHEILRKNKTTLKTIQSLIDKLQFAYRAIIPGRPFCHRLINSTRGLTKPFHHIRLNKSIKKDLVMWLSFSNTPMVQVYQFFMINTG